MRPPCPGFLGRGGGDLVAGADGAGGIGNAQHEFGAACLDQPIFAPGFCAFASHATSLSMLV
jgi:hypothetical protein